MSTLKCRGKEGVWWRRHRWNPASNVCKRCRRHRNPQAKALKVKESPDGE